MLADGQVGGATEAAGEGMDGLGRCNRFRHQQNIWLLLGRHRKAGRLGRSCFSHPEATHPHHPSDVW